MKGRRQHPPIRVLVLTLAALALGNQCHAFVIDEFTDGPILLQPLNQIPSAVTVVQSNLDAGTVIGGTRSIYISGNPASMLEIDPGAGVFSFDGAGYFGYFDLAYGSEVPLGMDLAADGSDAFLLSFSDVYTPGIMRAGLVFRVNGVAYSLRSDLYDVNGGPFEVRIPFLAFSSADALVVDTISFGGGRIEPTHRFVLDSITTIPEPGLLTLVLMGVGSVLAARRWRPSRWL